MNALVLEKKGCMPCPPVGARADGHPEDRRAAAPDRQVYGLTQKQIAEKRGIAEHTVETQVVNGMHTCARFFSRLGPL